MMARSPNDGEKGPLARLQLRRGCLALAEGQRGLDNRNLQPVSTIGKPLKQVFANHEPRSAPDDGLDQKCLPSANRCLLGGILLTSFASGLAGPGRQNPIARLPLCTRSLTLPE